MQDESGSLAFWLQDVFLGGLLARLLRLPKLSTQPRNGIFKTLGASVTAPSPGLLKVYHPNYASNNTIDAEDTRSVGCNPLTRPTATLSPWARE